MDMTDLTRGIATCKSAILQGDAERVAKQHAAGKCTARERAAKLFDDGSFIETAVLRQDACVVTGYGTVRGRAAYCFAQDFTVSGGALSKAQSDKILNLLSLAQTTGALVVAMLDSVGVKLQDGMDALPAYAAVLRRLARLSGVCPIIACVMGECRGIMTLVTQLADIAIQVEKTGVLALHNALVMNATEGKSSGEEALFGAEEMLGQGAIALKAATEDEATALISSLLDLLPACNTEDAPLYEQDDLNRVLYTVSPDETMHIVTELADNGQIIELNAAHGERAHTVLGRVGGRTAGIVATDPTVDNGRLDAASCEKIARFVRLCDCYGLPIVSLLHTDGLSVPKACGQASLLRAAAQMLYAYAEATSPKIALILGNAVGAAYAAMGGKAMADIAYAWPGAMISPLTREAAVQTLFDDRLQSGESRAALEDEYALSCGALECAKNGLVDDVIEPCDTRKMLIAAMEFLSSKHDVNLPRKHGNIPL